MKFTKSITSFLVFICLLLTIQGYSKGTLDSLISRFKLTPVDSLQFKILQNIEHELNEFDKDIEIETWNSLITHCKQNNYYKGLGFCYYNLAVRQKNEGEYFNAFNGYLESINNYEKCKYKPGLASVENGLGILYKDLDKFEQSLAHYNESARLYNELKDTVRVGWIYLNIGAMLEKQDSLELAKEYLRKSQNLLEQKEDINLLNCYINLGEVFNKENEHDSAFHYYSKSYELSKIADNLDDKFQAIYHLGEFLFRQERFLEATPIIEKAKIIFDQPEYFNSIRINDRANFTKLLSDYYALQKDSAQAYIYLKQSTIYETAIKIDEANLAYSRLEITQLETETQRQRKRRDYVIAITLAGLLFSLLYLMAVYRSYKHKKRANQLLTEMDELKTRLYDDITHEFRTPLTLILGILEKMLSEEAPKELSQSQVRLLRRNANSILNLVNQMLDLSKIDAKSLKLELVETDIVSFIGVHFMSFASLAEHKNIQYNTYLPSDKKIRLFDASKLEKIINNLISNAIKYTPLGGQVFCFASFPKLNRLELIIQDTGQGIPENEINQIFDRFHQVKGSNSNNIGTGIGLSLTKELIELMHGKVEVDSVVNEGTKFKIRIPLGKDHLTSDEYEIVEQYSHKNNDLSDELDTVIEEPECKDERTVTDNNHFPLILVVEDHIEINNFIKENFLNCYAVETAENGKVGLEKAIEKIPDLIITDLIMPEMDGLEMTKRLKTDERTSHIPIILLTAKVDDKNKMAGLESGADAFLPKPFNIKELSLRAEKLIEQRKKLRERFTKNITLQPKDIAVTSADEKFLNRALEIIENNIGNSDFEVRQLQKEMLMSRMQLFRKIKALTNQTPGEFIRTIRLKRAARLMDQNFGNIAQITYEVGFNNPSYFAKCFKDLFGKLPSDYMKKD